MQLPDRFDPTKLPGLAGYDNITWEIPEGTVTSDDLVRRVFLEWQQGVVWLEFHDVPGTDPFIRVTQLRDREILPQGVRALDGERQIVFQLGPNPGGIDIRKLVGQVPATDTVNLIVPRAIVEATDEEGGADDQPPRPD